MYFLKSTGVHVWTALRRKIISSPSLDPRILVAIHTERCPGVCSQMHQMPALFPPDPPASKGLYPSHQSMALFPVENGHRGVLPRALGNKKFLLVVTNYFTKWVEAEPVAQIREMDIIKFIRINILSRFGIPRAFVSDNGTQFVKKKLKICWIN